MTNFFIKKAFFDGWDNLFSLIFLNLASICLIALCVFVPPLFGSEGSIAFSLVLCFFILLLILWFSICVFALRVVADFGALSLRDLGSAVRRGFLPGLQAAALSLGFYLAIRIGLPFYLGRGGFVGFFAAGLLVWAGLVVLLALQWYLPLCAILGGGFLKTLRKCFVIFLDNGFFSLFLFSHTVFSVLVSCFFGLLAPGLAGIALAHDEALRLRLYKYDWLEANPGADRKRVPWDELLSGDRELVGKRTLKGMFFPWKE